MEYTSDMKQLGDFGKGFDPREPKGAWWRRQLLASAVIAPLAMSQMPLDAISPEQKLNTADAGMPAPVQVAMLDATAPIGVSAPQPEPTAVTVTEPSVLQKTFSKLGRTAQGYLASVFAAGSAHAAVKSPSAMEHMAFAAANHVRASEGPLSLSMRLGHGETVSELLEIVGLSTDESNLAIRALKQVVNLRTLRPGQEVTLSFDPDAEDRVFSGLSLKVDVDRAIAIERDAEGQFTGKEVVIPLERRVVRVDGRVRTSLYKSMRELGASPKAIGNFTKAFAYSVDMQRDVVGSDEFTMLYEVFLDEDGEAVRTGQVLYAALSARGKPYEFYRYDGQGREGFFSADGKSGRHFLMRTPVDGARLSSGYGYRKHPVLGYSRLHKGTDFAAPTGTPIMASGDGVVTKVQWGRGYGKYVKIRHGQGYTTLYGHMSRYAKGLKVGQRVRQGETIGYVGSTGMSTGPHLHYEVIYKGRHVNPMSAKVPSGIELAGADLRRFNAKKAELERQLAMAPTADRITEIYLAELEQKGAQEAKPDNAFAQASK